MATGEQVELATLGWVDWLNQVPARPPTMSRSPATGRCHGRAGYGRMWTLADSVVGRGRQLDLAEAAARLARSIAYGIQRKRGPLGPLLSVMAAQRQT